MDDVAAAVLQRTGTIDTFKLEKLVYYCQAWNLVWEGRPMFTARIEAWANGPVIPKLYRQHRGSYSVSTWPSGDPSRLDPPEAETVDIVVDFYQKYSGWELANLTHREAPWLDARKGLAAGERGNVEITPAAMLEFYGSLTPA